MTRFIDELREKKAARNGAGQSPFKLTSLEWCHAIEWRVGQLELDQIDDNGVDSEHVFLALTAATDIYGIKISLQNSPQYGNSQVALTQPPRGKRKIPTIVNIRARDAETALGLTLLFFEAYLEKDWFTLPKSQE